MSIGAFGENFPYTNFHNLNLDWVIKTLKEIVEKFDDAISSKITIADPIQWDITKQYEQLTIVMDNNKAYLSMKPVPSGISITNEEYWQNIFDITELIEEQEEFEQEINDKIDDLSDEISDGLEHLDNTKVSNNSTKHVLWVGDSYTTMNNGKIFDIFVRESGVPATQCHNEAVSGAGFTIAQTKTFLDIIEDYAGDKTAITDIIVCGGINDAKLAYNDGSADTSDLQTAILSFKNYATNNYPNAKLHIAYVGGCLPTSAYYETLHPHISQQWALWAYTVFAGGNGFNVLNAWNAIHADTGNYNSDGLHPNENYGSVAIGQAVANAFNGSPIIYQRPETIITLQGTGVNTRTISAFASIVNDIVSVEIPDNYIVIAQGQTINANDWKPVLALQHYLIRDPIFLTGMVSISGFTGMSAPKITPVAIMIRDGVLSIKIYSLSGSTFETFTASSWSTMTFININSIKVPIWSVN